MDNVALTHAVFDALEAGDFERFQSFFCPDGVLWQNFTNRDAPVQDVAAMLQGMRAGLKSDRYEDRRYVAIPGGAIAQHTKRATTLDGRVAEIPIMMRVFVEGGLVRRIEEYFDLAQAATLASQ